jgi:hypothetical protein
MGQFRTPLGLLTAAAAASLALACRPALFTVVVEARHLTADLRREFVQTVEASNRVVMSAGETAAPANDVAQRIAQLHEKVNRLRPMLESAGLTTESGHLDGFVGCLGEYEAVDREVLDLAADSSNVRARRLAAGPGQEAADAFRDRLEEAISGLDPETSPRAALAAANARRALLEIQLLESRHIPEPDDEVMTRIEAAMAASAHDARAALEDLRRLLPAGRRTQLEAAVAAFDRFSAAHAEVIALSRRNSNVRSLALSMGRTRALMLKCDASLAALEAALARHQFTGTR